MNISQRNQKIKARGAVSAPLSSVVRTPLPQIPPAPPLIQRVARAPRAQVNPAQPMVRRIATPSVAPQNGGARVPDARVQVVNRAMSVATTPAQIYGCTGLFDLCGDADLMSLSMAGAEPFLDWMGWEATTVCKIIKNFVDWVRPAYSGGNPTAGYLADACADSNGVEWGKCDFTLNDFGRLRRHTPTRDITKVGLRLCDTQPRYRLDGTPITDDLEYDLRIVTEGLLQDLRRYIVTGNKSTAGLFDGLERLVRAGYEDSDGRRCAMMDSIVVDWNANTLDGGAGMTWNSAALSSSFNFVDVLLAVYRRIRQRLSWAPALGSNLQVGDIAIVGTTNFNQCLLDQFTCWRVCPGAQYNEANLNSLEAREFRQGLTGGLYGAGKIFLDGFEIPLINYDWALQKGPTRSDAYLLTRKVGSVRLINGQYNDLRVAAEKRPDWYDATDGGRLLTWVNSEQTCDQREVEMQPRILMYAPWAQARFTDVKCTQPGPYLSPDPTESSFFPETSFFQAGS